MYQNQSVEIDGNVYQVIGQIGVGGMGLVRAVKCKGKKYAMKQIQQYGRNPIVCQMVDRQIQVQKKFKGIKQIIQIVCHKIEGKVMFIIFQLGESSLRTKIQCNTYIELRQFLNICVDTATALQAISQKQIIHRDIKPQNIICVQGNFKITDFGSLQKGTVGQSVIGTPLYLPPQVIFNEQDREYNQKIDVWSLGVTLFETYFGIHPFYYGSLENSDHSEVYCQLKQNIRKLIYPRFTVQKFIQHIDKKGLKQKAKSIENKLIVTPTQEEKERPMIDYFLMIFREQKQKLKKKQKKKVKLYIDRENMPSDLLQYVDTLNLLYDLHERIYIKQFSKVQFCIELGIFFWNSYNYNAKKYINYFNMAKLDLYKEKVDKLWKQVRQGCCQLWVQLKSSEQYNFFQLIHTFRVRLLLFAATYSIYDKKKDNEINKLFKLISDKTKIQINTMSQLFSYLGQYAILKQSQLNDIQDILFHRYFI